MVRVIFGQLRRRPGRAAALLIGVLIASLGFTVLTASTERSTLVVTGTVAENARGVYDILVRPRGAQSDLERERGLVRANFLGGVYGGITTDQWHRIEAVPGVEVAAPIAMIGYANSAVHLNVDITDAVDRSLETQLIRVRLTSTADRGLTSAEDPALGLVYVTKRDLHVAQHDSQERVVYDDGRSRDRAACGPIAEGSPYETQPDGSERAICIPFIKNAFEHIAREPNASSAMVQLLPDGSFRDELGATAPGLTIGIRVPLQLLVAAIDPVAENALVGLDRAVVDGRPLEAGEQNLPDPFHWTPALFANTSYVDEQLTAAIDTVADPDVGGIGYEEVAERAPTLLAGPPRTVARFDVEQVYREFLRTTTATPGAPKVRIAVFALVSRSGAPLYTTASGGGLTPGAQPSASEAWLAWSRSGPEAGQGAMPWLFSDGATRATSYVGTYSRTFYAAAVGVGVFDPARLRQAGELTTPLETYSLATATGADQRSRDLLGNQPLLPNSNTGGYLAPSPTVLIPLSLYAPEHPDPISAVRVRVSGITGLDALSRERVRLVAEDIAAATGLEVDVMLGASGSPQTIDLPAGRYGRPELLLAENWDKKGVAAQIIQAVDRKSAVLFGLILVVCALFLTNAVGAGVADRGRDLAVLACLGWSPWRLAGLVIGEVAVVGVAAGGLAAALATPIASAAGIGLPPTRSLLAIPVAVLLCVVAALLPARRAGGTQPARAIHSAVHVRRARRARFVLTLAGRNLRRTPGRTAMAALALAVGCAGLSLVLAITFAFHGTVTGTVLGDAVSLRSRGVDLVAIAAVLLLAVGAVADVLYLNIRDRAGEFAALRATGWSVAALTRLVGYEALGIGLLGALPGAAVGLAGAAWFTGTVGQSLLWTVILTAAAGIALAALAAVVPGLLQRRIPMARLLAEESA